MWVEYGIEDDREMGVDGGFGFVGIGDGRGVRLKEKQIQWSAMRSGVAIGAGGERIHSPCIGCS